MGVNHGMAPSPHTGNKMIYVYLRDSVPFLGEKHVEISRC